MSEEQFYNNREEENNNINFTEILLKYLYYWKWIAGAVVICLIIAFLYLRYTSPTYKVTSTILLRDDKKGGGVSELSMFENLGILNSKNNVDNEIEVLRSKNLIRSVVNELGLHTTYERQGRIRSAELYNESPVLVSLPKEYLDTLSYPVLMEIKMMEDGSLKVEAEQWKEKFSKTFAKLPDSLVTSAGTIVFELNPEIDPVYDRKIYATIYNPISITRDFLSRLDIAPTSKTTSVINLGLTETQVKRGVDFLNKLVEIYNRDAIEDKNRVARNTEDFIDERLVKIDLELGTTERGLETYKRKEGITDLQADAQLFLKEKSEYQKKRVEVETQINLVNYLEEYIKNNRNKDKLIPANVGITDLTLQGLAKQYNDMVLERDRLMLTSSENNPAVVSMNSTINALYENILASIASVSTGLEISKRDLDNQAKLYNTRITTVPTTERELAEMSRQQLIKSELYVLLLQKREENSLALAVTADNAKIIDDAMSTGRPISPKRSMIFLVALILGIAIPVVIIYLKDLLNIRINDRAELEKLTKAPILGEVPLGKKEGAIAVQENINDEMAEAFRAIRTNLQFMLSGAGHKVIMTTSSVPTEGKTFVSINMAISLALMGKRVLLIGLDVRKPMLAEHIKGLNSKVGITNYLGGIVDTPESIIQKSGICTGLDVIFSGPIPPNPAELLLSERLDKLIEELRVSYDYIIIDSAPIGLVSDSLIISRIVDATIYVSRAEVTYKRHMEWLNDLYKTNKLPHLSIILNGVNYEKKSYYGGYGYGYGYGYGGYGHQKKDKKGLWGMFKKK